MLGENCPLVTPIPENLDMFTSEQCTTPEESISPEKYEPSVEISPSEDSWEDFSSLGGRGADGGLTSSENSGLDHDS